MRKLKLLLSGLAFLVGGVLSADADTTILTADDGWQKITAMPGTVADYYFAIVDNSQDLMLTLSRGNNQSSDYNGLFYGTSANPLKDKSKLFSLETDGDYYVMRNVEYNGFFLQTEWNAAWYYRTHDNGGGDKKWGHIKFAYSDGVWTILNGVYEGFLGMWDDNGSPANGKDLAANKPADKKGTFQIYAILKTTVESYYAALHAGSTLGASPTTPADMTGLIVNPNARFWKDSKPFGWTTTGSQNINGGLGYDGFPGIFEYSNWGASNWTGSLKQTINVPNGKYLLKAAIMAETGVTAYLTANDDHSVNLEPIGANGGNINADGTETTMGEGERGFKYLTVETTVTTGTLELGTYAEASTIHQWVNADNFTLSYLDPFISAFGTKMELSTPTALSADTWYWFTAGSSGDYTFEAGNISDIVYVADQLQSTAPAPTAASATITLSAGTYCIKSSSAQTLTIAPPTYYLYDPANGKFLARGGNYGTRAVVDMYGVPFTITDNGNNGSLISFIDWPDTYMFFDQDNHANCWLYTDGAASRGNNRLFTFEEAPSGKYYLRDAAKTVYIKHDNSVLTVPTTSSSEATEWQLLSKAEHDAIVNAYPTQNKTNVIAAAGISTTAGNLEDFLSENYTPQNKNSYVGTPKFINSAGYWTWAGEKSQDGQPAFNVAAEAWVATGSWTQTVEDLPEGIYLITVNGFERRKNNADSYVLGERGYGNVTSSYLKANNEQVHFKSWYDDVTKNGDAYNPNSISEAVAAFNNGKYQNSLYTYVGADGKLTLTVAKPNYIWDCWTLWNDVTLTYYKPLATPEEIYADAVKLAADDDAIAVGKLRAAITAYDSDKNARALQMAVDQFESDNADLENDQTDKVNVAAEAWEGATGFADWAAPKVTTYDGRETYVVESFNGSTCEETGDIFSQTITGLVNGKYKISFYANANSTGDRDQLAGDTMEDKAEDVAYVYANDAKKFIVARRMTKVTNNGEYSFDLELTDGTIKLGFAKAKGGTNWHTMQIKQVTWFTTAKETYALRKTEMQELIDIADSLNSISSKTEGKEELAAAIETAKADMTSNMLNIPEFEDEIAKLEAAIATFKTANYTTFDGAFYVQHDNSKKFMAAGHEWGTRGMVNETGLDIVLTSDADTRMVTFDSNVYNGDDLHFLNDGLYMDATEYAWIIEKMGEDTYSISNNDGTKYISIDDNNNLVLVDAPVAWKFIDKASVESERMEKGLAALSEATEDNGVDATFLLKDAQFNRNDYRWAAWTVSEDYTNSNLGGGANSTVYNGCAETRNTTFTITQTIKNVPNGIYRLKAQGFYDKGDDATEATPFFFMNDAENLIMPVLAKTGEESTMTDAATTFAQDKDNYDMEEAIKCTVNNGTITVGIKDTVAHEWVCFDNFRLMYYGLSGDDVSNPPVAKKNLVYTGKPQVGIEPGSHEDEDGVQYEVQYSKDKNDEASWTADVNEMTFTEAGDYSIWYRAVNEEGLPVISPWMLTVTIKPAKAADVFDVKLSETEYTYDGTAKEPEATVTSSLGALEAGTDYTISYANNTNAGTAKVIVTGQGNYGGTKEVEFNIAKLALTGFKLLTTEMTYGENQAIEVDSVMAGEMKVPADAYIVSTDEELSVGVHTVTLKAKDSSNFDGELTAELTVNGMNIGDCNMTLETYSYTYNAKERKPAVTVTHNGRKLTEGVDYTLSYTSNVNAGTAKATITGIGNYSGTKETQFKITQGVGDIEMLNKEVTMPYNAGSFTVKPMVLLGDGPLRYASSNDSVAQVIYYTGEIFINSIGKTTITINMGSTPNATADTTSFVLTVTPASATLVNITRLSMGYGMPNFKVSSIRETLTEGKDYTLSYKDTEGKAVTEADMLAKPGRYVVVANLKGNYEGTQELEFTVSVDPTATGIDAVTGDDDGTVRYDVNGRRVEKTRRGLIIENGKKRYVKK